MMGGSGGPTMAKLVKQALSQCPKTKVLLGGYSQGAMVVHNAANSLDAGQITRLQAVVTGGVCDWSKPGIGQQAAVSPLTFAAGPGGVPLPAAPVSKAK